MLTRGPPQNQQWAMSVVGVDRKDAKSSAADSRGDADGVGVEGGSGVGMTASSSMWGVAPPAAANEGSESLPGEKRLLLYYCTTLGVLTPCGDSRPVLPTARQQRPVLPKVNWGISENKTTNSV